MKRNFTRLLLSAVLVMGCMVMANAQVGIRDSGELVEQKTGYIDGFKFALYKDYSYTYIYGNNVIKKSFSGNCAVVVGGYTDYSNIPSSVTYNNETYTVVAIGTGSQLNCHENLTIPNSVEVIECNAFNKTLSDSNNKLNSLTFADGDKDLYCFPLIEVTAKGGTFSGINTLKKLLLDRNLRYPGDDDNTQGSLAPFANGTFSELEVTVGPNVTKIPDFCFYKATLGTFSLFQGVKTLNLSNATSLQSIGRCAFYGAPIYMALDFSKATSLQAIGDMAFANCPLLNPNINFGDIPLSYIGVGAFLGCTNLSQAFFFSNTPPTFGESCFPDNTTVYVKNSKLVTEYSKVYDFKGKIIAYPDNMMLKYQTTDGKVLNCGDCLYSGYDTGYGTMYFDHVLASIGDHWFQQSSLSSISMPNTITRIETHAFYECTDLRTIVIPEAVNYFGDNAFAECYSLRDVFFLGNSDIEFGYRPFRGTTENTPATIYVAHVANFSGNWDNRPVCSWRSVKGDGTKEKPYEIENYINLYGFSFDVLKGNTGICGKLTADFSVNTGVLNEDGSLRTGPFKIWQPIGSCDSDPGTHNGFAGEFNGNGHTISGLYFNDDARGRVGLFGKTDDGAYIHDLGVKDSYFRGNNWVAGICGDFASGRIENCWNGATVISTGYESCAGGIAGSCWTNASMNGCYNIGNVSAESSDQSQCGGICGIVAKNANVEYSVSNCVSLDTKCSRAYTLRDCPIYKIDNVFMKSAQTFESGEVCYILNGNKIDTKWRQQIGKDSYPVLTGNYLVNYYNGHDSYYFYQETMCEHSANSIHDYSKSREIKRCDGSTFHYWHCSGCDKNYSYEGEGGHKNQTRELSGNECSGHLLELVRAAVMPTATTTGHYDYWHCTNTDCNKDFLEGDYHNPVTSEQLTVPVHSNNNEIWYTSTNREKIDPFKPDNFGATIQTNEYKYGLGKITFDKDVTTIGTEAFIGCNIYPNRTMCINLQSISIPSSVTSIGTGAFNYCSSLQSVTIPNSVTSIGDYAFEECSSFQAVTMPNSVTSIGKKAFAYCNSLTTITFNSLPVLGAEAFWPCDNLNNRILDLTDSDKPYIGNKMNDYYPFTEARYHRTLKKDTWGTIVLPFKPASTEGLKFYALQSMATGGEEGGTLTFMKVDAPEAGVPYLFRNEGESADFTLTAETPSSIVLNTQEIGTDFKMKGSFQQTSLNTTDKPNDNLYYLKDNGFYHANGQINIAPFRAYIEGNGAAQAKSFMLVISDNGDDVTAIPGIMNEDGTLDETEAIYDLSGKQLAAPLKGQVNIIRTKSGKTIKRMF